MNLISNNCFGGMYLRREKLQFKNPFIWTAINCKDFLNVIHNFDTINWMNYEIIKDKNWNFFINIDNKCKLNCVHYRFSKTDDKPRKSYVDVFYSKIWEYINEKYLTRLERMKEPPIFLIDWTDCLGFTEDELKKFINEYKGKYHCLIITNYSVHCNNTKIHIICGNPSSKVLGADRAEETVHDTIKQIINSLN